MLAMEPCDALRAGGNVCDENRSTAVVGSAVFPIVRWLFLKRRGAIRCRSSRRCDGFSSISVGRACFVGALVLVPALTVARAIHEPAPATIPVGDTRIRGVTGPHDWRRVDLLLPNAGFGVAFWGRAQISIIPISVSTGFDRYATSGVAAAAASVRCVVLVVPAMLGAFRINSGFEQILGQSIAHRIRADQIPALLFDRCQEPRQPVVDSPRSPWVPAFRQQRSSPQFHVRCVTPRSDPLPNSSTFPQMGPLPVLCLVYSPRWRHSSDEIRNSAWV